MSIPPDLTGLRFERLLVLSEDHPRFTPKGKKLRFFLTRCDCGTEKSIGRQSLVAGRIRSCGCLKIELQAKRIALVKLTHGATVGRAMTPEFRSWRSMRRRCRDKKAVNWERYGARGITVCPEWENSFATFLKDMGPKPSPKHQIDRIRNNEGYAPSNCKWSTVLEQAQNRRPHRTRAQILAGFQYS